MYILTPTFAGQTVTTATFYGPDTAIFTPSIGLGNVRAVGSYQYAESPSGVINHGMIYQGPVDGTGGTWTQIDVPSNGVNVVGGIVIGATVEDTILHSTMGDLVVGNYDLVRAARSASANGFIYNIATQQYTLLNINGSYDNLTSVYGIWENGVGSTSYTIAGGTKDGDGLNVAFLQNYNSSTRRVLRPHLLHRLQPAGRHHAFREHHGRARRLQPGGDDRRRAGLRLRARSMPTARSARRSGPHADLPGSDLMTGNIAYQNVVRRHLQHRRQRAPSAAISASSTSPMSTPTAD